MKLKASVTVAIAVLSVMLFSGFGCSNKYHRAIVAAHDIAIAVDVLQKAAHDAHAAGLTTNQEDIEIQGAIDKIAKDGAAVTQSIEQFKGTQGVKAALDAVLNDTNMLLNDNVIPIKNEKAKTSIRAAVVGIRALVDIIYASAG
jgi:hypothetical protein